MPDFNTLEWLGVAFGTWATVVGLICAGLHWAGCHDEVADQRLLPQDHSVSFVRPPYDWQEEGWA